MSTEFKRFSEGFEVLSEEEKKSVLKLNKEMGDILSRYNFRVVLSLISDMVCQIYQYADIDKELAFKALGQHWDKSEGKYNYNDLK